MYSGSRDAMCVIGCKVFLLVYVKSTLAIDVGVADDAESEI